MTSKPEAGPSEKQNGPLGAASTQTFAKADFTEAPPPRIEFERDPTPTAGRRLRFDKLQTSIEIAAYDVADRDRRVVALAHRLDPLGCARCFASEFPGIVFARKAVASPTFYETIADFQDAAERALNKSPLPRRGHAVFIETIGAGDTGCALANLPRGADPSGFASLTAWLGARDARLVIAVAIEDTKTVSWALEDYPGAYLLTPWTEVWLSNLSARCRYSYDDLRAFIPLLDKATGDDSPDGHRKEADLFVALTGEFEQYLGGGSLASASFEDIRAAIEKVIAEPPDPASREKAGRDRLDRLFGDKEHDNLLDRANARDAATTNPMACLALAITVLMTLPAEHDVAELARALAPDGEAPTRFHSEVMRERRARQREDQRKLGGRPVPPPPVWREVFDQDPGRFIAEAGLDLDVASRALCLRPDLKGLPLLDLLARKPLFLPGIAERIKTRRLFFTLPAKLMAALVDLVAGLHAIPGDLFVIGDLVTTVTGMDGERMSFGITPDLAAEVARTRLPDILSGLDASDVGDCAAFFMGVASHVHQSGDFEEHAMARDDAREPSHLLVTTRADANGISQEVAPHPEETEAKRKQAATIQAIARRLDEETHVVAAARVHQILSSIRHHPKLGPKVFDAFVADVATKASATALWLLFAFIVLYEPRADLAAFSGELLRPFKTEPRKTASYIDDLFGICHVTITSALSQVAAALRPYQRWADAIYAASEADRANAFAAALSIFADDFVSNFEIAWTRRTLDPNSGARPVLGALFFRGDLDGPTPNILQRLFARTAETHIDALITIEQTGTTDRYKTAYKQIFARLKDVCQVLIDEIDPWEGNARQLDVARMESLVWGAITAALDIPVLHTTDEATRLVLDRFACLPTDPRRKPIALLDLYAPAVLLNWRFRALPSCPLAADAKEAITFRDALLTLKKAASKRTSAIVEAFKALEDAQVAIIDCLESASCEKTLARHQGKLKVMRGIARIFSPTTLRSV